MKSRRVDYGVPTAIALWGVFFTSFFWIAFVGSAFSTDRAVEARDFLYGTYFGIAMMVVGYGWRFARWVRSKRDNGTVDTPDEPGADPDRG